MNNLTNTTEQLVPVFTANIGGQQVQACDARDLHTYLENGKQFADWIKGRIEKYEFIENQDFKLASPKSEASYGGQNRKDYHLSLDMAKELAMVENNARGRVVRRYFINMEKVAIEQMQVAKGRIEQTVLDLVQQVKVLTQQMLEMQANYSKLVESQIRVPAQPVATALSMAMVSARQVCDRLGIPAKGRGRLTTALSFKLAKWCAQRGVAVTTCPHSGLRLFASVEVDNYLQQGGREWLFWYKAMPEDATPKPQLGLPLATPPALQTSMPSGRQWN